MIPECLGRLVYRNWNLAGKIYSRFVRIPGGNGNSPGQLTRRCPDLANDFADVAKDRFSLLQEVRLHWKGDGVTLFINWAIKPFSMALLGWIFIQNLFADWLPADQLDS